MNTSIMIFGDQFVSSTLKPIIKRLESEETRQCLQLSTNGAGANTEVRIRCRVRLTVKDLIMLWEVREELPALTRLFVEDLYERRVSQITPRCLTWEDFRDKLFFTCPNHPWKVGRAQARLLQILSELRVFTWQPPRTRNKNRVRTPSAAGGSGKTGSPTYIPEVSNKMAWEEEKQRDYLQEQGRMLENATHLLAAERTVKMFVEYSKQQTKGEGVARSSQSAEKESSRRQPEDGPLDCTLLSSSPDIVERTGIERSQLCQFCPGTYREKCIKFKRLQSEGVRS